MLFFKLIFKEIYHFFSKKTGREFLRLTFWYGKKPRYKQMKVKTLGYTLEIPDALSWFWQFEEIFFQEFYLFPNKKNEIVHIIDCGANVGTSCLYFKKIFPQAHIIALEADKEIAFFLEKNLKNNLSPAQFEQIDIINKAVWVHNEGCSFESDGADGGMILMNEENEKNIQKIPSVRLKDILLEKKYIIDLLKIDIEGAETQVLVDCQDALHNVQHIFVEYHAYIHQPQTLHQILEILTKNNFRYFIKNSLDRKSPFINQKPKNNNAMDMQLNIFGYKV